MRGTGKIENDLLEEVAFSEDLKDGHCFYSVYNSHSYFIEPWNRTSKIVKRSSKELGMQNFKSKTFFHSPFKDKDKRESIRKRSCSLKNEVPLSTITIDVNLAPPEASQKRYYKVGPLLKDKKNRFKERKNQNIFSKNMEVERTACESPVRKGMTKSLRYTNPLRMKERQSKTREDLTRGSIQLKSEVFTREQLRREKGFYETLSHSFSASKHREQSEEKGEREDPGIRKGLRPRKGVFVAIHKMMSLKNYYRPQ